MKVSFYKLAVIFLIMGFLGSCAGLGLDEDLNGDLNEDLSEDLDGDSDNEKRERRREIDRGDYPLEMQIFVEDISAYAKSINPNFAIIPQNAEELVYNNASRSRGFRESYINAIDGVGIEELFYDRRKLSNNSRVTILKDIKSNYKNKQIMVADFVVNEDDMYDSVNLNQAENFIAFPRYNNYDYIYIPDPPPENIHFDNGNVNSLSEARNYLYMISTNNYRTKDAMIAAIRNTKYDVILIDLFFGSSALTKSDLAQLKKKDNGNGGNRLVISYISVGSAENYRYYWQKGWTKGNPQWLKKNYSGYPNEYWVEFWDPDWRHIIFGNDNSYIKKIIDAGFDGAYLDNVEAYYSLLRD